MKVFHSDLIGELLREAGKQDRDVSVQFVREPRQRISRMTAAVSLLDSPALFSLGFRVQGLGFRV